MRFDYLVLPVESVAELRTWYEDQLNLVADWANDDFVLLTNDEGSRLGFHRGDPLGDPGSVQLHFQVEDVDAVYEDLSQNGIRFTSPPESTPWGHRTAVCHDPAGHTVELFTPSSGG